MDIIARVDYIEVAMRGQEIERKVEELLSPILDRLNLVLYDIEWLSAGRYNYLRIFIDKEGGVTIRDCEIVSKELSEILDREDFIDVSYYLEVSSPGLTRELKKPKHFMKSVGCLVRFVVKESGGQRELVGRLVNADEEGAEFVIDEDREWFSYDDIVKAKLVYEERKEKGGR